MNFHKICLEDKEWVQRHFMEDDRQACEYSFANNYMWRNVYNVEVTEYEDCAIVRFHVEGMTAYSYPAGNGNKRKVIEKLLALCKEQGILLRMSPLMEEDRAELLEWFPGQFLIEADRDSFDYIYSREKLATLSGRKLHGKRNHIARFKDQEDWHYEVMTPEHIEECRRMSRVWVERREEKWNEEMEKEMSVVDEAMQNLQALGLVGGVLYKGGEMVAYTIGERLNSTTFVVHFEKAYPDIQGAYPMINQQFVLHECMDYQYVNREEDTGEPSLRQAKLSYYPEILLKKYVAVSGNIVFGDAKKDREAICNIWQTCFGDERKDVEFYLDHRMTENNMLLYWKDEKPVAMASFLPAFYGFGQERKAVRYVYAVATLPEYRHQGIAAELLKFGEEHFGEPLVLCPAEPHLWEYYGRLGFSKAFQKERRTFERKARETEIFLTKESPDPAAYKSARDEKYASGGYLEWPGEALSFALSYHQFYGGEIVKATKNIEEGTEESGWILYQKKEACLLITEYTMSKEWFEEAVAELLFMENVSKAELQIPGGMLRDTNKQLLEIREDGYLNLVMA